MQKSAWKGTHLLTQTAVAVALVALLAWLAFDSPNTEARWNAIAAEYERGSIGKLPVEESALLRETLDWLVPHAGITGPIVVNDRPKPGCLHVYTTTPEAVAVTGCARGNAVYDSVLDAVFIDESIIRPLELPLLGEKGRRSMMGINDLPFVPIYFRFILLHELGHRQLHRRSGGFFDSGGGARVMEKEADDFAVRKLGAAYAADLAVGGRRVGKGAGEFLHMERGGVSADERVWVDLGGAAAAMSLALMYSASDFSSFFEDTAHPNFVTRAGAILDSVIGAPDAGPMLKAHAKFHRAVLSRLQNLAGAKFAELHFPEGVQKVAFGGKHLLVMTNMGHVFRIPLGVVENAIGRGNRTLRLTEPTAPGPYQGIDDDHAWLSAMWVTPGTGPVIVRPVGRQFEMDALTVQDDGFIQLPTLKQAIGNDAYGTNLYVPPQPAEIAILSDTIRAGDDFTIIQGDAKILRADWGPLLTAIAAAANLPSVRAEISTVTDETAYLSVYDTSGPHHRMFGVAEFDFASNALRSVNALRLDLEGRPGISDDKLVAVPRDGGTRYLLLTRAQGYLKSYEVSAAAAPRLLSEHPLLIRSAESLKNFDRTQLRNLDPVLSGATWVPPGYVLVTVSSDSIYSVDLDTARTSVVFHPGTTVQSAIGASGQVAFFIANGPKVYVIHLAGDVTKQPSWRWVLGGVAAGACLWLAWRIVVRSTVSFKVPLLF